MQFFTRLRQFRTSFRYRLLLIFMSVTLIISTTLVGAFTADQYNSFKNNLTNKAEMLAHLLANGIQVPLYAEDHLAMSKRSTELIETPLVARVVITGTDGKVISDMRSPKVSGKASVISATVPVRISADLLSADYALTGVSKHNQKELGSVTVEIDTSDLYSSTLRSITLASVIALGFCILVVSISYPVLKKVTNSFHVLTGGLGQMMTGDFAMRIPAEFDDEAGRAAVAVNHLAKALEEREAENLKLQEELVRALRLEISKEKQSLMAKLIQTNRMTSIGLLASSMAHNINTPNGAVKIAGESLSRCWKDVVPILDRVAREEGDFVVGGLNFSIARDELQKAAESVVMNADRIARVINDLRCYSVGASWEFSPNVSVNKAAEGGLSIIRAHGKHAATPIHFQSDQTVPAVRGNLYQLEQVVVNLLQNALLAMKPDQGRITISTSHDIEKNEAVIIVQDDGEGITKDALRSLDEPFISTRLDRGGSGLGLYISNFMVKEHGGRISFESEPGKGTIARVHLPIEKV